MSKKHLPPQLRVPVERDNPAIVRYSQCINCGNCKFTCMDHAGVLGHYDLDKTGDMAICIHCGQCIMECPCIAMNDRFTYPVVKEAIAAQDKVVIASTSPAVRASLGEAFGLPEGEFVQGKLVALLRKLGFDYVLDTNFAADLTIVEEATELIGRIKDNTAPLPQFTSCCPAWVRFAELFYPELLPNISSAKSPIGMQGPTIKTYFAKKMCLDPKQIVNVAITPCTAKKAEILRPEMNAAGQYYGDAEMRDMDHVVTARELAQWAKESGIDFDALEPSEYDSLMGQSSGAGVIFGNTGGVMEAAIRTAYCYLTGSNPPAELFNLQPVRGLDAVREAEVSIGDLKLNVAVVYGTENARQFIEHMKQSGKIYHFVEVMSCPGGCVGGGGQPKSYAVRGCQPSERRVNALYQRDAAMHIRLSHENEEVKTLYREFYGEPMSELAEKLLHTAYSDASAELGQ